MQSPMRSLVVGVVFAVLLSPIAYGQDRSQSAPRHADASAVEKRIADLEAKLSAVTKEVEELRRDVEAQRSVMLIPLRSVDVEDAAKVIGEIYRGQPGIKVTALVKMKMVMVQADEKTIKGICEILRSLEAASQGKKDAVQRLAKVGKVASGTTTEYRLLFPEAIERAMMMDARTPNEQFRQMEQIKPMELRGPIKVEVLPPVHQEPPPDRKAAP